MSKWNPNPAPRPKVDVCCPGDRAVPDSIARLSRYVCCGEPEAYWEVVIEVLEMFRRDADRPASWAYETPYRHFAVQVLGSWPLKLMEHGVSVGQSWLTPEGEAALAFLREHGTRWHDQDGWVSVDEDVPVHISGNS